MFLQEEEEPELILDGGLLRYTTSSVTSNVLPVVEDTEMAVDEEEEEEVKNMAASSSPLYRRAPLCWEERTIFSSSLKASEAEEVTVGLLQGLDLCGRFSPFFLISFLDTE